VRTSRRSAVLLLALGAFLLLAASASASSLSYDGDTLVLTGGDNLDHEVQFRLSSNGSNDEILDNQGIPTGPGDCSYVVNPTWVTCPAKSAVRVELGAGDDSVTTQLDCFTGYTINLGDGTNSNNFNGDCDTPATATISGGSGQDTLHGGSATTAVTMFAGGGGDTLNGGDGNDVIHAGEGDDRSVFGGPGDDQLFGEGGADVIKGSAGNDFEDGGPGDDNIGGPLGLSSPRDNDQGADTLRGGDGTDGLVLESHAGGMNITLDDQPNDGSPNEGDNVAADFEHIDGTGSSDVFNGSGGNNQFSGGGGSDEIHGGGGADDLAGDGGDDRVFGDAGNDKVEGTNGADLVDGGSGMDQIYGDIANCSVFCNFDADQLLARDGERDVVDCGGGADQAQVDSLDIVAFCSNVDRSGPPAGGGGGGGAAASPLTAARSVKLKTLVKRGLVFRYKCAAACKVVATLSYKGKRLGAGRKTLRRAGTARVVVRIAKRSRAKLRRLRGKKLTLRVKVTSKGKTTTLTRKVTLTR
jgi:serralysin